MIVRPSADSVGTVTAPQLAGSLLPTTLLPTTRLPTTRLPTTLLTSPPIRASQVETAPVETDPSIEERTELEELLDTDKPWLVIVWNDPINLMSFVTFVFQKLFGYSKEKATKLMLDVHHKGRAVVSSGTRERAELDVYRLHEYGLWATMEPST